jgi:hypothetical protein
MRVGTIEVSKRHGDTVTITQPRTSREWEVFEVDGYTACHPRDVGVPKDVFIVAIAALHP